MRSHGFPVSNRRLATAGRNPCFEAIPPRKPMFTHFFDSFASVYRWFFV